MYHVTTMYISIQWALALIGCGVTAVLLLVTWRRPMGGRSLVDSLLHLLAGSLAGFLAIAFYPAWPLLAAIIGMLAIRAVRSARLPDVGLLAAGFGASWTALIGARIVNDRLDAAVSGSQDLAIPFALGVGLLILGLVLTIGGEVRVSRSR